MSQPLPSKEAKTSNLHNQKSVPALDAGNIIVNPAKLEKLKKIVKVSLFCEGKVICHGNPVFPWFFLLEHLKSL